MITVSGTGVQNSDGGIRDVDASPVEEKVLEAGRRFMDHFEVDGGKHRLFVGMSKSMPTHHMFSTVDVLDKVADFAPLPTNVALSQARRRNDGLEVVLAAVSAREVELLSASKKRDATNRDVARLNGVLSDNAAALSQADRRKDEFLSTLSHELRGPLSAAGMAVQMLQASPGDAAQTRRVSEIIGRQLKQISRLVEDLLDVSRVSQGILSIERNSLDVRDVLVATHEQMMPVVQQKRHALTMTLPKNTCVVQGDKARLIQVFSNLIGNAVRYTPEGGNIHVALEVGEAEFVVTVVDNGVGIEESVIPELFKMYVQAQRSSDRLGGGLGLGLPLVKSLVAVHGGSVDAQSAGAGFGSTFAVRLPRYM